MDRVLVTGGAGFIGSHLVNHHLNAGDSVTVIDNFVTGHSRNIELFKNNSNFSLIESDLIQALDVIKGQFDFIYHMASPASPPKYLAFPLETIEVNTTGTLLLLKYIQKHGGRLLFASTSEIYGDPLSHPQNESYWGNVNPIGPRSVYDEAKRLGETYVSYFQRELGANAVLVRIFNTFGPNMDPWDGRVVSTFIRNCLENKPMTVFGDGYQTRSFCYVDDLVAALVASMKSNISGPINLGNPEERTLLDLGAHVAEALGVKPIFEHLELPEDDPKQRKPDISMAKALLNWEPKISIDEGICKTATWMKSLL